MGEKPRPKNWPRPQRQTHGTNRRGVFPTRAFSDDLWQRREQSRRTKEAFLEKMHEKQREKSLEQTENWVFGNRELPINDKRAEILDTIDTNKASMLVGETGSGKSTQLAQYLYEDGYRTFHLVPRRIIADNLTDRIRVEMESHLNGQPAENIVGVTHGERVELHPDNKITVMTSNSFIRSLDRIKERYGDQKIAVVCDETHESNVYTDVAMAVAAMQTKEYDNWRIISASATPNVELVKRSFEQVNDGYVPIVEVEGRPFDLEVQERPQEESYEICSDIIDNHDRIMIFTSGKEEISYIIHQTERELIKHGVDPSTVEFRKLHAELTERELSEVGRQNEPGRKLVIVSSPAGMSGITISGVTCVISDGTINRQELDGDGVKGLRRDYMTKSEIIQQFGRAGRDIGGGIGYLSRPTNVKKSDMTFKSIGEREYYPPAEIHNTNLSQVVLDMSGLGVSFYDVNSFLQNQVEESRIIASEKNLSHLMALDRSGEITNIGRAMNRYPISPEMSRGIVEAERESASSQHMFRMALIAAAVEVGGLQNFDEDNHLKWSPLLSLADDDFIAQLEIALKLFDENSSDDETSLHDSIERYGLHPAKVEKARKIGRKILRNMHLRGENIIPLPPTLDEVENIRKHYTAGMVDFVYEQTGLDRDKKPLYQNILRDGTATRRRLSDRSVYEPEKGQYVTAFPRWYIKKGTIIKRDIVEQVMKTKRAYVEYYAKMHGILTTKTVGSTMRDGRVVEEQRNMFGTIPVNGVVQAEKTDHVPIESRRLLTRVALENPGKAQQALRKIADELKLYRKTIPETDLKEYLNDPTAPKIDHNYIQTLIYNSTQNTRSLQEIDRKIGEEIYSENISINNYYSDEVREYFQRRSPQLMELAGGEVRIHYDRGVPYLTGLTSQQKRSIGESLHLADGREILIQTPLVGGGKERISARELKLRLLGDLG